nr:AHH domain-containing protein [Myxococcus llanfairpwllgwyngyllgogerychwyrndrobwllllantysiliogogogochensis]
MGSPPALKRNILAGAAAEEHPWYSGRWTIAAHHLIPSEAMADDEVWMQFCWRFGYAINRALNGVILPMVMAVACELHAPVHVSHHGSGWAFDMDMAYPSATKARLAKVARAVAAGAYCSNPAGLTEELDRLSADILSRIASGRWTITSDGRDYLPGGNGCAGATSLQAKPSRACPHGRRHGSRQWRTGAPLARRALHVGA